ncbi:MAG TPA: ShlB/FhaC/HecB family hemolysin secretion/activation protein [Buttiauxella sp.]|jgi:hemolysin activation/secretion protein
MNIRFYFTLLIFLCGSFNAGAELQLNRLVKEQQKNDNNTLQESRVEKKDVFSGSSDSTASDIHFPKEDVCYRINELIINDDFLNTRATKNIRQQVAGKCLGAKGIEKAAVVLQDVFIKAGYVTTRIETPMQDLSTKKLILSVTPGLIENVIIEDQDVHDWVLPFGKGDLLNIRHVEQGLENLQKVPGVDVKINIVPGQQAGYSNIVIRTNRVKSWNARASYNNWGDKSTGRQLVGGIGYLYNMAGMSDLFYIAGNSSNTGAYKSLSGYYSFPVGFWDYELFYSHSESRQGISLGFMDLDYLGKSEYLSLKGSRTLYRDMDKKFTGSAEILRRKSNYRLGDIELALQKRDMGNLRLGVNYKQNLDNAALNSTLSWQRFLTWFGGEKTPDMVHGDVSPESEIFSLDVNYTKWLPVNSVRSYYEMHAGGQYTQDTLTLQDQLTIGNRWNVRGFENSTGIDGNKGFFMQNTLNMVTDYHHATLYLGADYGQISGDSYPQKAFNSKKLIGAAVGVKGNIKDLGYDASISAPLVYPSSLNVDDFIMNFSLVYQL